MKKKICTPFLFVLILFLYSLFTYADINSWMDYPDFMIEQYHNENTGLFRDRYIYCEFPDTSIKVKILPDGSAWFTETRKVFFHNFSSCEIDLLFPYQNGMTIDHLQVQEPGKSTADKSYADSSTFKGQYFITWDLSTKGDEYRTFIISYHVKNAILIHKDIADFNWQFIDRHADAGIRHLTVSIELPPGAKKNEVMAWGHGVAYRKFKVKDSRHIFCEMKYLFREIPLEGRIVFPKRLIQKGGIYHSDNAFPVIRANETARARQEFMHNYRMLIFGLITLICLTILLVNKTRQPKK